MATLIQTHTPRAMPKRDEYIASVARLIAEMKIGREMFSLTIMTVRPSGG